MRVKDKLEFRAFEEAKKPDPRSSGKWAIQVKRNSKWISVITGFSKEEVDKALGKMKKGKK